MGKFSKAYFATQRAEAHKQHGREFGKREGGQTWDNQSERAERERAVMVAEFHAWLIQTRIETENKVTTYEQHIRDLAPFAQAGLNYAETPADVPMCVLEWAEVVLDTMELKRKLALLNVYYTRAMNDNPDCWLHVATGDEAEINDLWNWFIEERNEKSDGKSGGGGAA